LTEEQTTKLTREQLYNEVWEISIAGVAKKYNAPYDEMLKLCKEADIPGPPSGYWSKLKFGKPVTQIPIPESSIIEVTLPSNSKLKRTRQTAATSVVTQEKSLDQDSLSEEQLVVETPNNLQEGVKVSDMPSQQLSFLQESEKQKIILAARLIKMPAENAQVHKKIAAYKSVVKEWNKKDRKSEGAQKSSNNYYSNRTPFLAGVISNESLPRIYRILDTLFRQIESLGGSVNDDLTLKIRNEHVKIEVTEDQDKINHVITKQEAQAIIEYEDAKRHRSWASEPKIRKYDYVFNGRLRISIRQGKYFRDTDKINIESRLDEILIELYEESEVVRIAREDQEEAERKRQEEARRKEDRRKRYNEEVERTITLENSALEFETACRIRDYVKVVATSCSQNGMDDETTAWVDWAMKKADWFDPIVARDDESFGEREHEKSLEEKALKKVGNYS